MNFVKSMTQNNKINIAEEIANFIIQTNFDSLSEQAITNVKRSYLDSLGVMIAGSNTDTVKSYLKFLLSNGHTGNSNVSIGDINVNLNILDATSLYGIMLHALDYDDTGAFSQGHPSSTVFPVIHSLSTHYNITGKDLITSYVLGVEILSRFSRSMPMMHLKGWHPTGIIGIIAATVTAAKLLKLDKDQIINSIGIACSSASGLVQNFGSMTKPLHAGNAVYNGLKAALLAKSGFTSNSNALDGELGFIQTYYQDKSKVNEFLHNYNTEFVIANPGINIKRHASCSLTHRSIDGVIKIVTENNIKKEDIKSIECYSSPRATKVLFYTNPQTELEAKFSMQYVLAVAALYQDLTPKQFSKENISKTDIQILMKKVIFDIHPDWIDGNDWRADKIILTTQEGKIFEELIQFPKGNVVLPLSWEEISEKFRSCCKDFYDNEKINELIKRIETIENHNLSINFNQLV